MIPRVTDFIRLIPGAIIGALLMLTVSKAILQPQAHERGREAERAAALERSMDLIRKRSATNDKIGRMSDGELCSALGGRWVPDEAVCE
ncbi:hypothetical protein GCM10007908_03880 [Rhizobium albus]|nr:hypothetical protein GCM10007908_03880 [Rhizobium albus]